jgi:hypothetical protein
MAFSVSTYAGAQPIANRETTQKHPLGTVVRGVDPTYGEGEFIYLKGVASTIVGSIVSYDVSFQTLLHTTALNLPRPVAVSQSICTASYYGWYQISGLAQAAKLSSTSFAASAAFAASAGLAIAVASGLILNGALVAVVASAQSATAPDLVTVMINRPHAPSDVS